MTTKPVPQQPKTLRVSSRPAPDMTYCFHQLQHARVQRKPLGFFARGWLAQAAKFLSVGVVNTLLDAALYFALTRWLGLAGLPVLAKGLSYGAGILNSFYWNKTWTFKVQGRTGWRVFGAFLLSNLVSLAINAAAMYACLELLALSEALAWLFATGAAFVWNFLVSKFIVFKR